MVTLDTGAVRGSQTDTYRQYQGIPYAAPPVGELRWRPPQEPEPWTGVRDARKPGPRCAQRESHQGRPGSSAEDCLHLNVTAPRAATERSPRPVMVWLHGGGFTEEAGGDYDARRLAVDGDVVVVTLNYRLGVLGLFTHPDLPGSGAYAIQDQRAALRWVQREIARFGGDPERVTLFGESAGGKSVCAHLASPAAEGLFHRAITQSAPCAGSVPAGTMFPGVPAFDQWQSATERAGDGLRVAAELGCAQRAKAPACLRRLPVEDLLRHHDKFISPAYGTPVLPTDPEAAQAAGDIHRVPLVSGITRDEMSYLTGLFYDLAGQPVTVDQYGELLRQAFGPDAAQVARRYLLDSYSSPSHAWASLTTDRVFACPTAERHAAHTTVWSYEFAEPGPRPPGLTFPPGAAHADDLDYLFPSYSAAPNPLSARMIAAWSRFAHTGDPGVPGWRPLDASGDARADAGTETLVLTADSEPAERVDLAREHECAFWWRMG